MLHIALWNIHGLSDYKFDDDFFMSLHCKYDIVGFTETMNQEQKSSRILFPIHCKRKET